MARLDTFTNGIQDTKMAKKFSIVHSDTATHHIHVAHAEASDGRLDKEIECFIAASENVEKVRPRCSPWKPVCKMTLQKCVSFLPVLVAVGYLGYVVFAIYRQPADAIAVSILTPLVVYVCLNRFSNGKLSKCIGFVFKKLGKCVTLSRRARLWTRRLFTVAGVIGVLALLVVDIWDDFERLRPAAGLLLLVLLAVIFSRAPKKINWNTVIWGILLQFYLGFIIIRWRIGFQAFQWLGTQISTLFAYTDVGSKFVFGEKYTDHMIVFKILPVLVFFSALIEVLYHVGAMQIVISAIAALLQLTMKTTPIESFATAAHIFIGQIESSVVLKPFFMKLTTSELHAIMTSGFATVAGSMFAATIEFGIPAEHLVSASFMSAPAALAISKISIPETQQSSIRRQKDLKVPSGTATNILEALAVGSTIAIKMIAYIVVNLIAFMATIAFLDAVLAYLGTRAGYPDLSFQLICSYIFFPFAIAVGIPTVDALAMGSVYGKKIILSEFLAYIELGEKTKEELLQRKSLVLGTYMLCGFGSLISIGIYLGALFSAAPDRRNDFARLSLRGLVHGNIACLMTACVAGLLYKEVDLSTSLEMDNITTSVYNTSTITFDLNNPNATYTII